MKMKNISRLGVLTLLTLFQLLSCAPRPSSGLQVLAQFGPLAILVLIILFPLLHNYSWRRKLVAIGLLVILPIGGLWLWDEYKIAQYETFLDERAKEVAIQPRAKAEAEKRAREAKRVSGETALIKTVNHGYTDTVKLLLETGTNIETKNGNGETALIRAVYHGHANTVKLLLEKGANIEAKGVYSETALIMAVKYSHATTIQALLDKGADVNAKDKYGMTALMWAVKEGYVKTVQVLLNEGANMDAIDWMGKTALTLAKHTQIVRLLKKARSERGANWARIKAEKRAQLARAEAEKRESPANLVLSNPQFQDYDSFCYHDKIFNAGEKANIEFDLKNEGKGIGFEVNLDINDDRNEIDALDFKENLGDIQPGESKKITIPIKAGLNLKNGAAVFLIQAKEKRGYHSQKVKLAIQTSALIPPKLEIKSVEINDGNIGQAKGNGNGIPENNETIELIAYVKNSGQGDALRVYLDLASINPGLKVIKQKTNIGVIHPGQTIKGKLVFSIPRAFQADRLNYKLKVDDVRGADSQSRQFAYKFKKLAPVLDYAHNIYDGNSANSKGNRNGKIENGETIEIEIIAKNKGSLDAQGVEIGLSAPGSLSLNKNNASVGTILPHDQGEKKSFILPIPRTFQKNKINLDLRISQADFPALSKTLSLDVKPVRPKLVFTHQIIGNIQQGQSAELEVIVRNEGKLDAEGVKVAVDIDLKGIDIRSREKSWGRLPAGSATDPLRFSFYVKRSASPGNLPIKVNITQSDFPQVSDILAFNIREEGVVEVAVQGSKTGTPQYSRSANYSFNMAPTIVIASPTSKQSYKPEITLVADVADDKEISRITVKLNDQIIADNNFRGIEVEEKGKSSRRKRIVRQLKLNSGKNQITVIAYDNENQISQETITVSYHKEKGEIWAVLIGINNYQNEKLNLKYAVNDVRSMKSYLINDFGIPEDHVTVLLDGEATLGRIKKVLGTELKKKAGQEDQVIIYFSGHGAPEQDDESPDGDGFEKYLLPFNVDPDDLFSTALPMKDISTIFGRIKAERIVFLADTCFSGASGGKIFKTAPISDKFWDRISRGKGRVILSASSAKEVAEERDSLEHGVFTYYLLEGLRGKADLDGDGLIDTGEIYRYVSKKVPAATGQQQNPIKKGEVEGQIVLGRVK